MDSITHLQENLNEQQLDAVSTTEGYVRVIAGAGSGKTKALTSRYAYIVEALGISASNILCVTFTNKAAREMRNRVKKLIGDQHDLSYITTYHGFCVRVLREDVNRIGYPKNFVIMDVEDQKTILRDIYNEFGITSKLITFKQILRHISKRKSSQEYLDFIINPVKKNPNNDLDNIFYRYLEKQQRNFALDFDDLINFTLFIFLTNNDILEKWQKKLHYIQVDEMQDSSQKQFSLVSMLSELNKNLFVVGDPDQTIYEWRGAKPEFLVDFDQQFPDTKTIIMNQNYRSTPNILTLGNHIIKRNKIRIDKDMFTQNPEGVQVVHFHAKNESEEGNWVADEISNLVLKEGHKYSDFAILYRANHVSRSIEQSLVKKNIPYTIFGGIRFFERKEIKDVLSFLRLVEFEDDISFLRVINTPSRGLGKKFIGQVSEIAERENTSMYNALINNLDTEGINRKGALDFINLIESIKKFKADKKISDLIKIILDKSGLTEVFRTDGDTDRLDNIKELQNSVIALETEDEQIHLHEFLQDITLYTDVDLEEDFSDKVKLMTIHTSKGLEFPYVFICGFNDGILPSAMSIKERRAKAIEEERRLTYVAITRAEKGLYLTESEGYNFSTGQNKQPSRFLYEISEQFLIHKGEFRKEEDDSHFRTPSTLTGIPLDEEYKVGDIIEHKIWDEGKIIEVNHDKGEYLIYFSLIDSNKPINFEFKGLTLLNSKSGSNFDEATVQSEPEVSEPLEKKMEEAEVKNDLETLLAETPTEITIHLKKFAKKEYPKDKDMQEYVLKNQIQSYNYMLAAVDKRVKKISEKEWPSDFTMQQHVYDRNLQSKAFMKNVSDKELKIYAKKEWPSDFTMQEHVYVKQLEAKEQMLIFENKKFVTRAIQEWPDDYTMQVYFYQKLMSGEEK